MEPVSEMMRVDVGVVGAVGVFEPPPEHPVMPAMSNTAPVAIASNSLTVRNIWHSRSAETLGRELAECSPSAEGRAEYSLCSGLAMRRAGHMRRRSPAALGRLQTGLMTERETGGEDYLAENAEDACAPKRLSADRTRRTMEGRAIGLGRYGDRRSSEGSSACAAPSSVSI